MTTKAPKGQVQFVIHLAEGWWAAIGRDESEGGPSVGKFTPVQFRKAARRGAAKRKAVKAKAKPKKGRPTLSLVKGTGKRHFEPGTVVPVSAHEVCEHMRTLPSGKTVRVRAHNRGPMARHYG